MTDDAAAPRWTGALDPLAAAQFHGVAVEQAVDAKLAVNRDPRDFLHYPLPSLDALVGGVGPGEVDFVGGFSGNGKTTLLTSLLDGWAEAGRRVYYVPLETPAQTMRVMWACFRADVHPGDALTGELRRRELAGDLVAASARRRIRDELAAQTGEAGARVFFADLDWLTVQTATDALNDAADFHADVVIIDHIDHIRPGRDGNLFAESVNVCRTLLSGAQALGLRVVATTQFNNEAVKGDRLAKYHPPQPQHVYLGGHKRQIATRFLGLWRPLEVAPADPEEFARKVKAVRAGAEPRQVLEPDAMGVVCMKHRYYGAREGERAFLTVQHGRAVEPCDALRRAVEQVKHGIRTGGYAE